jgi:hypothetical protein
MEIILYCIVLFHYKEQDYNFLTVFFFEKSENFVKKTSNQISPLFPRCVHVITQLRVCITISQVFISLYQYQPQMKEDSTKVEICDNLKQFFSKQCATKALILASFTRSYHFRTNFRLSIVEFFLVSRIHSKPNFYHISSFPSPPILVLSRPNCDDQSQ